MAFPSGTFDAIHASLIPKGAHRGHVMVFNYLVYASDGVGQTRVITYSIVDPETQQFWDHIVCLVPDQGDLFCAGHAWNAAGDLVLAGGTTKHGTPFGGAKLLYVWQPPTALGGQGTWNPGSVLLDDFRWYPTLVALGPDPMTDEDKVMVLGGTDDFRSQVMNSYQVWKPSGGPGGSWEFNTPGPKPNTFDGPAVAGSELSDYPRAHFLSTKEVGTAGMVPLSAKVNHFSEPKWPLAAMAPMGGSPAGRYRVYGSSVLFPISPGGGTKDILVAIGGQYVPASPNDPVTILNTFEWSNAGVASPSWTQSTATLTQPRWFLNSVLLPDSTIFVFGGEQVYTGFGCSEVPALVPEIFVGGQWSPKAAGTIIRDYHSTGLLLPSGKVLTAGGESRHYDPWPNCANRTGRVPTVAPADFQVFVPPSLNCGYVRPTLSVAPGATLEWAYGAQEVVGYVTLPFGITVSKVVLMRAGSVTHHCDPNQRCVELAFTVVPDSDPPTGSGELHVAVPTKASYLLPRGYYMLFCISSQGVPSKAAWVRLS